MSLEERIMKLEESTEVLTKEVDYLYMRAKLKDNDVLKCKEAAKFLRYELSYFYQIRRRQNAPRAIGRYKNKYLVADLRDWEDSKAGLSKTDRKIEDHRAKAKGVIAA